MDKLRFVLAVVGLAQLGRYVGMGEGFICMFEFTTWDLDSASRAPRASCAAILRA